MQKCEFSLSSKVTKGDFGNDLGKIPQAYYTIRIIHVLFKTVQNSVQTVDNSLKNRAFSL